MTIRAAERVDARRLAALATQLGYPSTAAELAPRLAAVAATGADAVHVAERTGCGVIGWVHVGTFASLVVDGALQLKGLVVDEAHRGEGVGTLLLAAAEAWALQCGCPLVSLRTDVLREDAHAFYVRRGYALDKQQLVFRKRLT